MTMTDQPICQALRDEDPCAYPAVMVVPVRLCEEHKVQVAAVVVPDLLASALRNARAVGGRTLSGEAARLVSNASAAGLPTTDPHPVLVYFMANGGRVKIGYTKSLFSRISSLSLREDAVLLLLHGGTDLERALHAKFGAHRVADSEWFELAPDLVHFISDKGPKHRGGSLTRRPTRENARRSRAGAVRKAPRRSMDDWVEVAGPIFHAELHRLRRQPTASEFASAIDAAGHGRVSDSTAKNIRTEILDRTDVPALDDSD
jgi:hypothetical protein